MSGKCRKGIPDQKLETMAAGLHTLWPKGLICEAYDVPERLKDVQPDYVDTINAALKRLSKVDGHGNQTEVMLQEYARGCNPYWFKNL